MSSTSPSSKMHLKTLFLVPALACIASFLFVPTEAIGSLILAAGTTTYVLSSTQVALAVAGLAGLAIVKEALIFAELGRSRGKRSLDDDVATIDNKQFDAFFDAVAKVDVTDCGKLLVCELMTKNDLDRDEKRIVDLFDDLEHIDPSSGKAEFQLAAYLGTLNSTEEVSTKLYS